MPELESGIRSPSQKIGPCRGILRPGMAAEPGLPRVIFTPNHSSVPLDRGTFHTVRHF